MSVATKSFANIFNSGNWEGERKLLDGTLQTENGTTFKIHRVVLSQRSGYFRAVFNFDLNQETVVIPNVHSNILETILVYIYTGEIALDEKNVWALMIASDYLLLDDLLKLCRSFAVRTLTIPNCLSSLSIAWQIERLGIAEECYRYALVHFEDILGTSNSGLEELPFEVLNNLLRSNSLNVSSERSVWIAIVAWIEANPSLRLAHVPVLLTCLRLEERSDEELAAEILSHTIITNNPFCMDLMLTEKAGYYLTKCSMLSQRFEAIPYKDLQCSVPREPKHLYLIAWNKLATAKYGSELFLTYDSELNFCRRIGETNFFIDTMVQIGQFIYLFNVWQNTNLIFDVVEEVILPMAIPPGPCSNCTIIILNERLYSIGGTRDGHDSTTDMIYRYSFRRNRWRSILMTHHLALYGAVVLNDLIYVIGLTVFEPAPFLICRAYEPVTDTWILIPSPNIYRRGFFVVAFHDQMFVIGGENDGQYLKSVEAYDPYQDKWMFLPDLPFQYFFPKAVIVDDKMVVYENTNAYTRYCNVAPPVYWDRNVHLWQVIDESSPLYCIERYTFLLLEDDQLVTDITKGNRGPGIEWERIPRV